MTNTTTRTPTPYSIGSTPTTIVSTGTDGQTIIVAVTEPPGAMQAYGQMCADARYLVKAANSHELLVAALRDVVDALDAFGNLPDGMMHPWPWNQHKAEDKIKAARAALAAAEAA